MAMTEAGQVIDDFQMRLKPALGAFLASGSR